MISVVKHISNDNSIDFEFVGFELWDDYDALMDILTTHFNAKISEDVEGIYSRECMVEIDNIKFKLTYHEDTGNCLCPLQDDKSVANYLENLAQKILPYVND